SAGLAYYCFFGAASPSKLPDDNKAGDSQGKLIYKLKPVTRPLIELTKEDHESVQQMTRKAIEYLKKTQNKAGSWDGAFTDSYASLAGLTLLESGVPATDPVVQKAAQFARIKLATVFNQHPHQTYTLSLTLLFFDKLGDPSDKENLKKIALRLMA